MDSEILEHMDACKDCRWWYDPPGECKKPSERMVSPEIGNKPAVYEAVDCPKDVHIPQQEQAETDSILG